VKGVAVGVAVSGFVSYLSSRAVPVFVCRNWVKLRTNGKLGGGGVGFGVINI